MVGQALNKVLISGGVDVKSAASTLVSRKPVENFSSPFETSKHHPDSIAEQEDYRHGRETSVPPTVLSGLKWMAHAGLEVTLFRKLLTYGCKEAIEARRIALKDDSIEYEDELKTITFEGKDKISGKTIRIALHMEGTAKINGEEDRSAPAQVRKYMNKLTSAEGKHLYNFRTMRYAPDALVGRQDPLAVSYDSPDSIHVFQRGLAENKDREMYCNIGRNTWSVKLNISEFIKNFSEITTVHMGSGFMHATPDNNVTISSASSMGEEPDTGIARIG